MTAISEPIELYPHEINGVRLIWAHLQRKYGGLVGNRENLLALASEARGRFLDELNLNIHVDISNMEMDGQGSYMMVPEITVIGRVTPEAFDFARAQYEVQHGFADGVVGSIKEDGTLAEPTANIAVSGTSEG